MDECSSKPSWESLFVPRKGSTLVRRDTLNDRDRNRRYCSRIGCVGNPNSPVGVRVGSLEKNKSLRPSLQSTSNGKGVMGSSSRTYSAVNNTRNSLPDASKESCLQLTETGATLPDEADVPELLSLQDNTESSGVAAVHVGSSNVPITARTRRNLNRKSGLGDLDAVSTTRWMGRGDLGSLRCDLVSDVVPSSSSSGSDLTGRKDVVKRRNCEGETSSSSQGKRVTKSWFERGNTSSCSVTTVSRCNSVSGVGSSSLSSVSDLPGKKDVKRRVYEGESSSSAMGKRTGKSWFQRGNTSSVSSVDVRDSRLARDGLRERGNVGSVRTRRSLSGYTRTRITGLGNGNNLLPNDSRGLSPQISELDVSINLDTPSTALQLPVETSLSRSSSYGHPGNEGSQVARPSSPVEVGSRRTSLLNRESFRRYNMEGIAEVLLALERIEQDEELTYEQLLVLETNLFLNGLNIYDQHRDMRLDIDNMSYEELLALEERMGTVSTALSEEALTQCVKSSIFHSTHAEEAAIEVNGDNNDVKCSICQDEYNDGEEVGRLQCEHRYHTICVQQWLRLKNWCPICKVSAVPSSAPPAT